MPTREDITQLVLSDHRPGGPDGASNVDRHVFVCEVFETATVDLDADYSFDNINACKDIDTVEACRHLCILKMHHTKEMVDHGLADPVEGDITLAFMTLTIQRINWHLEHLGMGRRTPPFPGLN